jgi:beta-lactamase regulating signal transducer with metallopeptidase domain
MSLLTELTLRGSAAVLIILVLERTLGGRISSPSRRLWWGVLPLAFLVPLRVPVFPALGRLPPVAEVRSPISLLAPLAPPVGGKRALGAGTLEIGLWLFGGFVYAAMVGVQTARATRRWSRERLSTEKALLHLLEGCKSESGVTVPVGLVVSSSVPSPAIMGWLRPRILLPESVATGTPASELRPILLHELAHLRSHDVPFNWLLTIVRAVHWFNPLAHLGAISWSRFREEAADEAAIRWMRDDSGAAYGEALVRSLRLHRRASAPFGSLAIIESVHHLKKRINMITRYKNKSPRLLLTGITLFSMAAVVCSISGKADDTTSSDPNVATVATAQRFLTELDDHRFEAVWNENTTRLQKVMGTESDYIALMEKSKRSLFGKCSERKLAADVLFKTDPEPNFKGDYAYLYFDSSFANNPVPQRELVILRKEADGTWKIDSWAYDDRDKMPLTAFLPK